MTIIERKQLAAMQRRVGPNTVGYYGVLQPFADALKLILKENVIPAQSNKVIFYLAPVSSLIFSLSKGARKNLSTGKRFAEVGERSSCTANGSAKKLT